MSEIQPSFATLNQIAGAPEEITIGTAAGNLSSSTFGQVAPGSCAQMGKDADKWYRKKQIGFYTTVRNQAASAIVTIVTDSNELSFQRSLDYFLDPDGLPHGMFMKLKQTLGSSFTASDVKKEYEKGTLVNDEEFAYEILDENREDPLFIPQNEPRTFTYPQYIYQDVPCHETALGVPTDVCCVFGGPSPLPGATPANARVTKATDDVAYFMAGVRYTPPLSIIQKMLKIGVKNPDSDSANFGKDLDGTLSEEKLFRARAKHQRTMFQVFSAAKPYGGEYPESGNMMDSSGFSGTSGESFKGAKLFGIADVDEVGGVRVHRADGTIANRDYQGNINGEVPFYAEDFLH
jgi:hypothetical protein